MKLFIVESPAKCPLIRKYLPDGFHVLASVGHIRDLDKPNSLSPAIIPMYAIPVTGW